MYHVFISRQCIFLIINIDQFPLLNSSFFRYLFQLMDSTLIVLSFAYIFTYIFFLEH